VSNPPNFCGFLSAAIYTNMASINKDAECVLSNAAAAWSTATTVSHKFTKLASEIKTHKNLEHNLFEKYAST